MSSASPARSGAGTPSHQQQAPHLLALKVLRSTKPTLVPSTPYEQPYEDGAGAADFAQLERTSGRSTSGGGGGMLRLPAEFGAIYLGETFSAVLSLSNDALTSADGAAVVAQSPVLKVEMHTALNPQTGQPANTHLLATVTAAEGLAPGSSSEAIASHELKELGQHALVCTVQYGQVVEVEGARRVVSRSFRKVYKFAVASPLSVRTKAHSPPSTCATSYLSSSQRSLIFLEVQVHNHHISPLFFERMRLEPLVQLGEDATPGLTLAEEFPDPNEGLFDDEADTLLPPGGVRQFLYVLRQSEAERKKAVPGANQGLGRLDIVWRTPHGEIGRLQSSTLGRRIPAPTAPPLVPPSSLPPALPPHLGGPSPALPPLPPNSPPQAGVAPFQAFTPADQLNSGEASAPVPRLPNAEGLAFDLTVGDLSSSAAEVAVDRPFSLDFRLSVSSFAPPHPTDPTVPPSPPWKRRLRLAAQHVQFHPPALAGPSSSSLPPPSYAARPGHASKSSATLALPGSFQQQQQPPRPSLDSIASSALSAPSSQPTFPTTLPASSSPTPAAMLSGVRLPPPHPLNPLDPSLPPAMRPASLLPSPDVVRLGPEIVDLGEVVVGDEEGGGKQELEWKMRFMARAEGLKRVGGVRVLLLDAVDDGAEGAAEGEGEKTARIVGEWDVVAEVWVGGSG
ncbi:hypothetical protein JCM8097_006289 [Rhodosporidiobolus ruineniae]